MTLRFQRLILILLTLSMLGAALLLILFNTKQNIVFFYTPSELLENNIALDKKLRIGGYVKKSSFVEKSLNFQLIGGILFTNPQALVNSHHHL